MTSETSQLTRRDLLKTGATVAAGALIGGRLASKAFAASVSEIVWGTNEAYARPKFLEPFEKESGTAVKTELFSDPAEVVTKLKAGGAGVHMLVDGCYHVEISHAEGVLQPIDVDPRLL